MNRTLVGYNQCNVFKHAFDLFRVSSTSSCSLPQLDQRVLAGYAPTLVVSQRVKEYGFNYMCQVISALL